MGDDILSLRHVLMYWNFVTHYFIHDEATFPPRALRTECYTLYRPGPVWYRHHVTLSILFVCCPTPSYFSLLYSRSRF